MTSMRRGGAFAGAGLNVPHYSLISPDPGGQTTWRFPCVLKPLHFSASRGVIRADTITEFLAASARIRKMTGEQGSILVEDFIPGREFALEGLVTDGKLQTLAIFDKPDPLDGPFFEETIYVTPSRQDPVTLQAIEQAAQSAVSALGLRFGPVHAEMRVNQQGVWMLEAAARPIGGLCSRVLRFTTGTGSPADRDIGDVSRDIGLEELLLRHAVGDDVSGMRLAPGAHGVMMIPIPTAGLYSGVDGLERARQTADIEAIEISAKEGQMLQVLPEGSSYLGFLFARAADSGRVENALREAHACLQFHIERMLPVVR